MRPEQRRERILEMLHEHERVTVDFLADRLAASRGTIQSK